MLTVEKTMKLRRHHQLRTAVYLSLSLTLVDLTGLFSGRSILMKQRDNILLTAGTFTA